jgi:hypothetical protein
VWLLTRSHDCANFNGNVRFVVYPMAMDCANNFLANYRLSFPALKHFRECCIKSDETPFYILKSLYGK